MHFVKKHVAALTVLAAMSTATSGVTAAVVTIAADTTNDYLLSEGSGTPTAASASASALRAGAATGTGSGRNSIFYFAIPNLTSGETVTGLTITSTVASYTAPTGSAVTNYNTDAYVIGTPVGGPSARILRYNESDVSESAASIKLQDNIYSPTIAANTAVTTDAAAELLLVSYLNTFYTTTPTYDAATQQRFLAIRLNQDADVATVTNNNGYLIYSAESTTNSYRPFATLTTTATTITPEPATAITVAAAIGALARRRRR